MPEINFPYTVIQLTEQVNRIPNTYGLLRAMNLFPSEGAISRLVEIRMEDGVLKVLPSKVPGAPGENAQRETGSTIFLEIPHFPHNDLITPQDLDMMTVVAGRMKRPAMMDDEVAKRLRNIRTNHDITLEYIRMGALKGLIKDGHGATLYNLYTVFGISPKAVDFKLGTSTTDMIGKCDEVFQHIATNLKGETMSRVEVLVSSTFFNRFIQHAKVEKYWTSNQMGIAAIALAERTALGGQFGRMFEFQNIFFREYYGSVPITNPTTGVQTSEALVATGEGWAYPTGTMDTFKTWNAPAFDIRYVNTPGEEIYVSPKVLDHGAGVELRSQSNPLAINKRPEVVVKLHTTD